MARRRVGGAMASAANRAMATYSGEMARLSINTTNANPHDHVNTGDRVPLANPSDVTHNAMAAATSIPLGLTCAIKNHAAGVAATTVLSAASRRRESRTTVHAEANSTLASRALTTRMA